MKVDYLELRGVIEGIAQLYTHGSLIFPEKAEPIMVEFNESNHRYKIDGAEVPSVTTILDLTEVKAALTWWGFRVGLAMAIRAVQANKVSLGQLQSWSWEPVLKPALYYAEGHPDVTVDPTKRGQPKPKHAIEHAAMDMRHHPNAIKEDRGSVGTSVHVAAEVLQLTGQVPDIGDFPEADRGYIQALAAYYLEQEPETEAQEVIVASRRFAYAGRFDTITRTLQGERRMRDYKTSGGVYSSFDKQLALYDIAYLEMGGEPVDGHDVVHLRPDGTYVIVPMVVDHMDALAALLKHRTDKILKTRLKREGRDA
jgi:hypothetical protein